MHHRHVRSELADRLDLPDERRAGENALEELVVALDHGRPACGAAAVERHVVDVSGNRLAIGDGVAVGPASEELVEETSNLRITPAGSWSRASRAATWQGGPASAG